MHTRQVTKQQIRVLHPVMACFSTARPAAACSHAPCRPYLQHYMLLKALAHTCSSIQSNSLLTYSGADRRTGFFTLTPSAHRYSYCSAHARQKNHEVTLLSCFHAWMSSKDKPQWRPIKGSIKQATFNRPCLRYNHSGTLMQGCWCMVCT